MNEINPRFLEIAALMGARASRQLDKSDWIRVWAMARKAQDLPYDSKDWEEAYKSDLQYNSNP